MSMFMFLCSNFKGSPVKVHWKWVISVVWNLVEHIPFYCCAHSASIKMILFTWLHSELHELRFLFPKLNKYHVYLQRLFWSLWFLRCSEFLYNIFPPWIIINGLLFGVGTIFYFLEVSYAHPGCIYLQKNYSIIIGAESLVGSLSTCSAVALRASRARVPACVLFPIPPPPLSHFASCLTTVLSNKDKKKKNGKLSNIVKCYYNLK